MLDLNNFFYFVDVAALPQQAERCEFPNPPSVIAFRNRTSRKFGMMDAGQDFYWHAVAMLREAELAETAIRHRLTEPTGTVRCMAGVATMQFAMSAMPPP